MVWLLFRCFGDLGISVHDAEELFVKPFFFLLVSCREFMKEEVEILEFGAEIPGNLETGVMFSDLLFLILWRLHTRPYRV